MSSLSTPTGDGVGVGISLWIRCAIIAGLTGTAACGAANSDLPPDGRHRVETVPLSAELESLGGIGGVSVDSEGHIILANFNKYVWRISPEGNVRTPHRSLS